MPPRVIGKSSHGSKARTEGSGRGESGWVGSVAWPPSPTPSARSWPSSATATSTAACASSRPDDLPEGDVTVRVRFSSVNYKDALAVSPKGRVARTSPLVPGIDLAGEVVDGEGTGGEVIVHGYDLGVAHHGGYAEYARVPAGWVVPLPDGLSARQAMALGTAGYTAALFGRPARGPRPDAR